LPARSADAADSPAPAEPVLPADVRFQSQVDVVPNEPQVMLARLDAPAEQALHPDAAYSPVLPHWLVAALLPDAERLRLLPGARWLQVPALVRHETAHSPQVARFSAPVDLSLERRAAALLRVSLCERWAQPLAAVQKKQAELAAV